MGGDASPAFLSSCIFAAGALAGASLAYAACFSRLPSLQQPGGGVKQPPTPAFSLDDEVLSEALARNVQFFGRDGQQQVSDAFVVVVGLGVRQQ